MHLLITTAHRLDSEALGYALRHELPGDLVDDVTLLAPTVLEAPTAPPRRPCTWLVVDVRGLCETALLRAMRWWAQAGAQIVALHDGTSAELMQAMAFSGAQHLVDVSESLDGLVALLSDPRAAATHARDVTARLWANSITPDRLQLTRREGEVVDLYLDPDEPSIAEVAERLHITPSTVKAHLSSVRKKLGGRLGRSRLALRRALAEHGRQTW